MSVVQQMADFLWENGFVDGEPVDVIPLMERLKATFPTATLDQLCDASLIVGSRWRAAYGALAERHGAIIRARLPRIN